MSERPSQAEIFDLLNGRKPVFRPLFRDMDIDTDFIDATAVWGRNIMRAYIKGFPKDFLLKVFPLAKYAVQVGTDNILVGETPRVRVHIAKGAGQARGTREQQRSKLEAWCQAFTHWVDHHGTTETPLREYVQKTVGLGAGVLSYALDKSKWPEKPQHGRATKDEQKAWDEYERRKKMTVPFDVRAVHPRNVLWDPDHDPPEDVFIEEKVSRSAMVRAYPHLKAMFQSKWRENQRKQATRVTYCSKDWYAVYVDEVPVLEDSIEGVVKNPWGRVWLQVALSGYGNMDAEYALEKRVQGIVRAGRDVIAAAITNYNVKEAIRAIRGLPGMDFSGMDADAVRRTMEEYEVGPTALNQLYEGTQVTNSPMAQIPDFIFRLDEDIQQALEMWAGPDILRGLKQTDNATVNMTNLSQAKAVYRAAKKSCEQGYAQMLMDILYMVKHDLDDEVYLPGIEGDGLLAIAPDDIPDHGMWLEVDFSPPTQEERNARKIEDKADLDAGAISMKTYRERQGIQNGDEEDRQRIKELLRFSETVLAVDAQLVAQKIQELAPQQEQERREKELQRGVIPPDLPEPEMEMGAQYPAPMVMA